MSAPAFALLETMPWTPEAGIARLSAHLGRLMEAAGFFGFSVEEVVVRAALEEALAGHQAPARVRLTVAEDGTPTVEVGVLEAPTEPLRVAVYPAPVQAGGPFWRHKTTLRAHYEEPYAWARTYGLDDALLVDAQGVVVEATRASVWIEAEGRQLTPSLEAGGLPGVYRAHLLATHPEAEEAEVTVDMLRTAPALYLSNAVKGRVRAELVETGFGRRG